MPPRKPFFPAMLFLLATFSIAGQSGPRSHLYYINTYKDIAIREMQRTGIPASITLAQGILESQAGLSELAIRAKNHFGIKVGGDWPGPAYCKIDDDRGPDGTLTESCFRSYPTVEASFVDHSDFLASPRKTQRYGFLFGLAPTDYEGWAIGLQKAGYATNTAYARQLISLIGRYELFKYDTVACLPATAESAAGFYPSISYTSGNVPFTAATGNETAHEISRRFNIPLGDLLACNEDLPVGYFIPRGQKVFLAGVDVKETAPAPPDTDAAALDTVFGILHELLKQSPAPAPNDPAPAPNEEQGTAPPSPYGYSSGTAAGVEEGPAPAPEQAPQFYTVRRGDTLWRIAQDYHTTVSALRKWNNITGNYIRRGMVLRVK